jgi:cytochrome b
MSAITKEETPRLLVWDLPTRVMHWLLAGFIGLCWWSGINNELEYHLYSGYAVLWIVFLRLFWGVAGSSTSKFANFIRGPKAIFDYVRTLPKRTSEHSFGHNPLGALSVLLLLGTVLSVAGVGLFAVDVDGLYSGPLSGFVSFRLGRHLAHLHYKVFNLLLAVIALHLAAVAFYYVYKGHNLVSPMITGRIEAEVAPPADMMIAPAWRLAIGVIFASAMLWGITNLFYYW